MHPYLAVSQIPELAGLNPVQRKAVYRCALEAFYAEEPARVWLGLPWMLGGLLAGALVGAVALAVTGLAYSKLLVVTLCGCAGVAVGIFVAAQLQTAQLRPYLRRVLEERKDEIARIN